MNGASSAAVSSRQWRRVAKAARSPSQKRRRESRTYQFEQLLDELGDLAPGGGAVEAVHVLAYRADRCLKP